MKEKLITLLMVLAVGLFCGFVVIAPALDTLDSPLNRIAGAQICGERSLEIEKDSSVFIQGEQTHQVTAYCVDKAGEKQDMSVELMGAITKLQIAAGFISALVIFGLAMLFLQWAARRLNTSWDKLFQPSVRRDV
ncbi:MAG: hypothetical protein QM730_02295 [Anaerolineales bacterium]